MLITVDVMKRAVKSSGNVHQRTVISNGRECLITVIWMTSWCNSGIEDCKRCLDEHLHRARGCENASASMMVSHYRTVYINLSHSTIPSAIISLLSQNFYQADTLYFVMRDKTLEVKEGLFYSADAAYFIFKELSSSW